MRCANRRMRRLDPGRSHLAPYTASMPACEKRAIVPGPRGPGPGVDAEPQRPPVPSLGSFLRSRFISANGIVAALYLLLSLWIYRNPEQARAIWKRLQGQ
jgi:hypothetical protein